MSKIDCFEHSFVYTDTETGEFKNARVKLKIDEDDFLLEVYSPDEILKGELEEILNQLNTTFLRRMRISLSEECRVVVKTDNETKQAHISEGGIFVRDIVPMED